jgi:NOL1/NOP2/sun family putative RNA methylase
MKLPEAFETQFRSLLDDAEADAFFASFDAPRTRGLRVNTLKISVQDYLARVASTADTGDAPASVADTGDVPASAAGTGSATDISRGSGLTPVAWTRDGFSHDGSGAPGRHPDYHAGLYYLQDPSAMLPAALLSPQPGEAVLDCCAAPGGKTVQLAAMMQNRGFLLANDISPKRVKPLRRNLEGLGVACAAVTNEDPARLAAAFPAFFDALLLDVPCSGEGMFRKDETAVRSWKRHDARALQTIQRTLLQQAHAMLRPGGRMVYATCTYNPDENERQIAWALEQYPDLSLVPVPGYPGGLAPGRADWVPNHPELAGAARVWPHLANGEGQFAALLQKDGARETDPPAPVPLHGATLGNGVPAAALEALRVFFVDTLTPDATFLGLDTHPLACLGAPHRLVLFGSALYWAGYGAACPPQRLEGLRVEMPGLYLGEWQSGRYTPSAAFVHALRHDAVRRRLTLDVRDADVSRYLHGETLMHEGERGWLAVAVDGYPLGWGKQEDGFIKNQYPKGWRML